MCNSLTRRYRTIFSSSGAREQNWIGSGCILSMMLDSLFWHLVLFQILVLIFCLYDSSSPIVPFAGTWVVLESKTVNQFSKEIDEAPVQAFIWSLAFQTSIICNALTFCSLFLLQASLPEWPSTATGGAMDCGPGSPKRESWQWGLQLCTSHVFLPGIRWTAMLSSQSQAENLGMWSGNFETIAWNYFCEAVSWSLEQTLCRFKVYSWIKRRWKEAI